MSFLPFFDTKYYLPSFYLLSLLNLFMSFIFFLFFPSLYLHCPQASIRSLEASIRSVIVQPLNSLPFLNAGRMVHVKDGDVDWGWGLITGFQVCLCECVALVERNALLNVFVYKRRN